MDHNVPEAVVRWFEARGADVIRVRDVMPADAADPVVATAAMKDDRVLVSWDKDFGHQRFRKPAFRRLRRIGFSCAKPDGVRRLNEVERILFLALDADDGPPIETRIARDKIMFRDVRSNDE